jgi:uncharacterized protein
MTLMEKIRDRLVDAIFEYPKRTFAISLILFFITAVPIINLKSDYTFKAWYNDSDPLVKLYNDFESYFGNDDTLIVLTEHKNSVLAAEDMKYLKELTDILWEVKDVQRVDSIVNYDFVLLENEEIVIKNSTQTDLDPEWLKKQIEANPKLKGYLVDQDLKTSVFMVQIKPSFEKAVEYSAIYNDAVSKISKLNKPDSISIHFMGTVPLSHYFNDAAIHDMEVLIPFLYVIIFCLLFFLYRRVSAILLTFAVVTLSILSMMGLMAFMGYKLNNLSSSVSTILLTISIADILHILTTFYISLGKEKTPLEALDYSLRKNFYPTLLTSVTTAVGFYSFFTAYVAPISELGFVVGHGVVLSWLYTYMFLGPLLIFIYKRKKEKAFEEIKVLDFNYTPAMDFLRKHCRIGMLLTVILTVVCVYFASKVEIDMDPFAQFKDKHIMVKSQKFFENKLKWSSTLEILVDAEKPQGAKEPEHLRQLESFITWLEAQNYIHKTISILDTVKTLNKTLHNDDPSFDRVPGSIEEVSQYLLLYSLGLPQGKNINNYLSVNEDKTRITCMWDIHTSSESLEKIDAIEAKAKELGLNAKVTGKVPMFHELTPYVVKTFYASLFFTAVSISIILMIALKSVGLGLIGLVPNIFPLIISMAVFQLMGYTADIAAVLVASISLGIAVDDTIHFLFEYKRFVNMGQSPYEAVINVTKSSFASLFNTSLILILGFSSFYFATYLPISTFGLLSAFVVVLAMLSDFIVTPIIIFFFFDKNKNNKSN